METIMLDSSVWISLLGQDVNTENAEKIHDHIKSLKCEIILPIIIYVEVTNNIIKLDKTGLIRGNFEEIIRLNKIKILFPSEKFWYNAIVNCTKGIRLKTLDLLILNSVLEYKVGEFFTFDKKLKAAYDLIKKL
jgi:predicted nucleic acid-binding protein